MWMVAAYRRTHRPSRLTWFEGCRYLVLSLYSSNELGELSQWPRHDDSTIDIVIIINYYFLTLGKNNPEGVKILKKRKYKDGYEHSVGAIIGW